MRSYLLNLSKIPSFYKRTTAFLKDHKKVIEKTIAVDIENIKKENDNSLSEKDFTKITTYGYAISLIFGQAYCILRNKNMTLEEKYALTYLGGLTGLFDDLFDEKDTPESRIKQLIEDPTETVPDNSYEKLFLIFSKKALGYSSDTELLKFNSSKIYKAQVWSKKQLLPEIEKKEIENITYEKGGVSILFYCSIFGKLAQQEKNMLYHLGAVLQLENDIFDVYKDHNEGIGTLVTTETKINNLRIKYNKLTKELINLVHQTHYPKKNKINFLRYVLLIICRANVCLDFLEKNEKLTNNTFSIKDYKRTDLVCDMSKMKNIVKLLNYYAKSKVD